MSQDPIKDIEKAAGIAFKACKELGAGQVNVVARDKNEKPIAGFFCTVDSTLSERLEAVIKQWENEESESDITVKSDLKHQIAST
jgi:hypothetical protein